MSPSSSQRNHCCAPQANCKSVMLKIALKTHYLLTSTDKVTKEMFSFASVCHSDHRWGPHMMTACDVTTQWQFTFTWDFPPPPWLASPPTITHGCPGKHPSPYGRDPSSVRHISTLFNFDLTAHGSPSGHVQTCIT